MSHPAKTHTEKKTSLLDSLYYKKRIEQAAYHKNT